MDISLPFVRDFLSIACLLFGTVMVSKVVMQGRINGLQCFIGIIAFLCLWSIIVPYAYQCVGHWLIEFTGERIPQLISLIWWPTELALSPVFAVLYLTAMSGIVLFAFVGSDKDDDDETFAHRHAVFEVAQWLNRRLLICLGIYWLISRVVRHVVMPWLGIAL